jgi:orotate phosphoribosyltransferase
MKPVTIFHSGYLSNIFNPDSLVRTVNRTNERLKIFRFRKKFDAIAFSGNSGAGICYPLSYMYKWPIICVRKEELSHGCDIEGTRAEIKKYVIVDDFINSGNTVKRIIDKLLPASCVGIYIYNEDKFLYYNYKEDVLLEVKIGK